MVEEPVLRIKDGRHILYEMCAERFIANDTMISGGLEGDMCSMVSSLASGLPQLIEADGRNRCEWLGEVSVWEAGMFLVNDVADRV